MHTKTNELFKRERPDRSYFSNCIQEQEATVVLHFDPHPEGDKVEVKTSFLSLHNLKFAHADGVKESIANCLHSLGR